MEKLLEELRLKAINEPLDVPYLDLLYLSHPQPYYRFLYLVTKELKPQISVELGTGTGRGTAFLAAGNPDGKVVTVDPELHGAFEVITAPYQNIEFIQTRSDDPNLLARFDDGNVGLCFVDSVHSHAYVMAEVGLWTPKMEKGGLFLFDDLELNEGMKKVLPDLPFERKGLLNGLHPHENAGFGYAVVS